MDTLKLVLVPDGILDFVHGCSPTEYGCSPTEYGCSPSLHAIERYERKSITYSADTSSTCDERAPACNALQAFTLRPKAALRPLGRPLDIVTGMRTKSLMLQMYSTGAASRSSPCISPTMTQEALSYTKDVPQKDESRDQEARQSRHCHQHLTSTALSHLHYPMSPTQLVALSQ